MTDAIFNLLVCLGIVVSALGCVCRVRAIYHTKNPQDEWYGRLAGTPA
jgi:hypothetical protein